MSKSDIFQNPDILSEIIKNFDYLSLEGRVGCVKAMEAVIESKGLPVEMWDRIITDTMKSRAAYNQTLYDSVILRNTITSTTHGDINYIFSVVYPKGDPIPEIDTVKFLRFFTVGFGNINKIIDNKGLIWSLDGISGIITNPSNSIKYQIYCHDRSVYYVQTIRNNILYKTKWYKSGKPHRDNDLPAEIYYFPDGKTIRKESWYKQGKLYSPHFTGQHLSGHPGQITYGKSGDTTWVQEAIWFGDKGNELATRFYMESGDMSASQSGFPNFR